MTINKLVSARRTVNGIRIGDGTTSSKIEASAGASDENWIHLCGENTHVALEGIESISTA